MRVGGNCHPAALKIGRWFGNGMRRAKDRDEKDANRVFHEKAFAHAVFSGENAMGRDGAGFGLSVTA